MSSRHLQLRGGLCMGAMCLVAMGLVATAIAAEDDSLAAQYGFMPVEIFKLSERSSSMLTGDFNHDGRADVVTINNAESRLDIFLQRGDAPKGAAAASVEDVNRIDSDWRFEHRKLPVDREVTALAVADFNHDGRVDIACFGQPDQLTIRYQPVEGLWTEKSTFRLPDVGATTWSMAAGDLNSDGMDDLVVLAKQDTLVLYQQKNNVWGPPRKIMNTSDKLGLVQIADVNGDGRQDLCYLAGEGSAKSLAVRLQLPDGQLAPEYVFDLERPRAVTLRDVDPRPGSEVLVIDARTGRLKLLGVESQPFAQGTLPERLVQYGFGKSGSGKDRDVVTGDVDGDGAIDVLVTDPEASRLILFRQQHGQLDLGTPYPGLVGADQARIADVDGDGRQEIVIQSVSEKTIGVSRFENGRLTFPQALTIDAEPAGLELLDADGDGRLEIAYLTRERKGKEIAFALRALQRTAEGEWRPYNFAGKAGGAAKLAHPLELKGTPERLATSDLNGDGHPELLVFLGSSRAPLVVSLVKDGPVELAATGGLGLGNVGAGGLTFGALGGKRGVLVAQENLARHLQLDEQNRWQVTEQFNSTESNVRIAAAAALELNGTPEPEVVLVDTGVKKLRVLQMSEGGYQPWKEIDLGEMGFRTLVTADLNRDQKPDLLVVGSDKFAVLLAGGQAPTLKELASFESKLEKIFPTDVAAGDLNGDGLADLALTDTRSRFLEILNYQPGQGLRHALYFRVYEQKAFSNDDNTGTEPREVLIADVTGDGRPDLLLLIHDRMLLYPQDAGPVGGTGQVTGNR